jgi:outer membrane protein TolC
MVWTALGLLGLTSPPLFSQEKPSPPAPAGGAAAATMRITLEEAKQRALDSSKLLTIGNLNAESKAFAVKAAQADYFPKIIGSEWYFHFQDDLGKVLTTQGRTLTGPKGKPLLTFPPTTVEAAVFNQNSNFATIAALQPVTDLLKVRQGVRIAQADEQIAQAQLEKGIRELVSGVEQLYWGLLAVQRIRAGAAEGVRGAEMAARSKALEARTALVEARQALHEVEKQIADLQEQLNGLLGLPLCTSLELVEPAFPVLPYHCADEVVTLALRASPDLREAQQTVLKAEAALRAGKLDYVPSIVLVGGYFNQTAADYMQQNIGYVGVMGSYTFVDWGKRRNTIRERHNLVAMASLKLQQTEDDVRQKAVKLFREFEESQQALKTAEEMAQLRRQAEKQVTAPEALMAAAKARMTAEVDAVKADLAYRQAYVQLMALVGGN